MKNNQDHFKFFESILTYAVDENLDAELNVYSDHFNEKIFFAKAYVYRSKKELELEDEILKDAHHTYFIGQPGTGKTTILRKVLLKIKEEQDAILFQFDIKRVPDINNEANASFGNMLKFLTDLIKEEIDKNYILDGKIDIRDIIIFYLDDKKRLEGLNNPVFAEYLAMLTMEFSLDLDSKKGAFSEWLKTQFFRKLPDSIKNIIRSISQHLQPHNYLYYLANAGLQPRICIVAFDNVDSIIINENRTAFMKVIRNGFNNYKNSTRMVCTIRAKNVINYSDIGSFIVNEVNLDYDDLIQTALLNKEISDLDPANKQLEEEKTFIKLKHLKKAKEQFAKLIYERRFKYFRDLKGNDDALDEMQYFYQLIMDDDWLTVAFFDLTNFDRRKMLVEISDFISYIVFEKELNIEELKLNKPQIGVILQTCFYGWVKKSKKFYEDAIYNIPRDVYNKKKNKTSPAKCNIDHLIFCVIFNVSKQSYPAYNYDNRASLKRVLSLLCELGYDINFLKDRIRFLHKNASGINNGLLDFYTNDDKLTADENELVSLTPRSYYLLVFSSLKFVSVFADLREEERVIYRGKDFSKYENDLEPVTKVKLRLYLQFLCDLAKFHVESLKDLKKILSPRHGTGWLDYYKMHFCLKTGPDRPIKGTLGELLFDNLLNSNSKFLYTQQAIESTLYGGNVRRIKHDVIEQFKTLQKNFDKEVSKLEADDYDVSKIDFAKSIQFDALD